MKQYSYIRVLFVFLSIPAHICFSYQQTYVTCASRFLNAEIENGSCTYGVDIHPYRIADSVPSRTSQAAQRAVVYHAQIDHFLHSCSKDAFASYLQSCGIATIHECAARLELWKYPVFWEYIEADLHGHEAIEQFTKRFLTNNKTFRARVCNWLGGSYSAGAKEFVEKKYAAHCTRHEAHIEKQKQLQEQSARERIQQEQCIQETQQKAAIRTAIKNNYHQIGIYNNKEQLCTEWRATTDERLHARATAWEQNETWSEHHFILNERQTLFVRTFNNPDQWATLYGTQFQKQLHHELLDLFNDTEDLLHEDLFKEAVDIAHQANCAGYVDTAWTFVDLCYALQKGLCKGALQATEELTAALVNPLHTIIHTVGALTHVAKIGIKAAHISAQLAYYYATDQDTFYTTYNDICDYNKCLYNTVCDYLYNTDPRTLVCEATALYY